MSDIYLQITETPTVVTLSAPVVASVMVNTVTVANIVTVSLDSNSLSALENVTVTVGAAITGTVTVGNFPATQAVSLASTTVTVSSLPALVAGTAQIGSVTVGNSVTIGNFPATQAVSLASLPALAAGTAQIGSVTASISGTVPVSGTFWQATQPVSGTFYQATQPVSLASVPAHAVTLTSTTVTVSSLPALAAGTAQIGSVTASISNTVTVGNSVTIGSIPAISGAVTVSQLPRVTLIDNSGSITVANSAVTVFASSTTRSYLLVQVTTGSVFLNVGATATTLNGISLTAGQGYAWETTIPQGIVSLISTTTSSLYVAKQA